MLLPLLTALLQFSSVSAAPTEPSKLSIPVHDIIRKDLSAHEAHPNFKLYTRWLGTPEGAYIRRDPKAAFTKYSNIVTIDCHADLETCLLTSRVSFVDITNSKRELDELNNALEAQLEARDEGDPAALVLRQLEKRAGEETLYSSTHLKTYHDMGPDDPKAGFQHYIVWDTKCQTLQYSSNGFHLTDKEFVPGRGVTGQLMATYIGDVDPGRTHSVKISITFLCGIFSNKCCVNSHWTANYIDGKEVVTPHSEPIECVAGKDVSKQNCETAHSGWCGVHIRQYQKNEGPGLNTENYRFDVILYDSDQELIGEADLLSIPSGQTQQVGSTLPMTFGVTAPNLDDDAVYMSYNGASWGSNDQEHHCDFGKFDSGHRDGDCGFTC